MKYNIIVHGCQMNISDSERISSIIESLNYKKTSKINEADLIIVTMCSIRKSAVDRIYGVANKFKKLKKHKKNLITILTGCILKKDKKSFEKYFDYILDIKDINKIPQILRKKQKFKQKNYLDISPKYNSKFSATIPIMTGCNNFCSYCVVPYTRQREISRSMSKILTEIKKLVKSGYKEIWLLGQNVNSYKDGKNSFPELLKKANEIPGNFWLRYTSSHPKDFNEKVIDTMALGGNISPYLNLPIQSGDSKILKLMNRHYTVKEYKDKIKRLRKKIPDICLSTDIIVGFPGETKKQFDNTVKLFKEIEYDMAYINKYSPRFGTAAAKMEDDVDFSEKKRREIILNKTLEKTALKNNKKFIGKETIVLIDSRKKDELFGKNKYYKTVRIKSNKNLIGEFVKVKIIDAMAWTLKGKII